jgi:hypothetical protein
VRTVPAIAPMPTPKIEKRSKNSREVAIGFGFPYFSGWTDFFSRRSDGFSRFFRGAGGNGTGHGFPQQIYNSIIDRSAAFFSCP